MGICTWIIFGFFAGLIGRALMPGHQPMGFIMTTLLGIGGAFVGGSIASVISGGDPMKLRHVLVCALVPLTALGACKKRPQTSPTPDGDTTVVTGNGATGEDSIRLAEAERERLANERAERDRLERERVERETAGAREVLTEIVFFEYDSDQIGSEAEDKLARAAEEEVAAEDGELVAEGGGGGGDAAAEVGAVDDVVVQEGRDVDHLDDLGEAELRGEQAGGGREGRG